MNDGRSRLELWVEAAAGTAELWGSAPNWRADVLRRDVDGETIVWSDHSMFSVAQPAAAVMALLDGTVTLAQLAGDLAAVAEVPLDAARAVVATAALELITLGAIDGVDAPEPPAVAPSHPAAGSLPQDVVGPGTTIDDLEAGDVIRVVRGVSPNGDPVVTEYLSNGRRRMTTKVTIGADPQDQSLLAAAMSGERSMAELVPGDSCLGSKLRNHDGVPLVSIACEDGVVRSVRCHDPAVAEALRCRAGDALVSGRRGPIMAFVVTPLDGDGPRRVFDGLGRRRGRPRSNTEIVSLVDQILGEFTTAARGLPPSERLTLTSALVTGPDRPSVLVPLDLLYGLHVAGRLRRGGWNITWTGAELDSAGQAVAPSAFGTPVVAGDDLVVVATDASVQPLVGRVQSLIDPRSIPAEHRSGVLDTLATLARSARWETLDQPLPDVLDRVAGGSAHV